MDLMHPNVEICDQMVVRAAHISMVCGARGGTCNRVPLVSGDRTM